MPLPSPLPNQLLKPAPHRLPHANPPRNHPLRLPDPSIRNRPNNLVELPPRIDIAPYIRHALPVHPTRIQHRQFFEQRDIDYCTASTDGLDGGIERSLDAGTLVDGVRAEAVVYGGEVGGERGGEGVDYVGCAGGGCVGAAGGGGLRDEDGGDGVGTEGEDYCYAYGA
jgi:hypothetical protein